MKFLLLAGVALLAVPGVSTAALAGPFQVSLPVEGLTAAHGPQIEKLFEERFGRNVLQFSVKDGLLEFLAGGESAKSLLQLSAVAEALAGLDLKIQTESWLLKAQEIGFQVSSADGISERELQQILESFEGAEVELLGSLLWKSSLIAVVHVHTEIDLSALRKHLESRSVAIDDLVWGHWKYGWKIGAKDGGHGHAMGARRKNG